MTNTKLHILFISDWFPSRTRPTLGNFVQRHAEAAGRYSEISVIHACIDNKLQKNNYEITAETTNGILTIIVYYKKASWSFVAFKRYLTAYKLGYKKLLEFKNKPSLVHLNTLVKTGIVALYFKYKFGLDYVYSENWTGFLPGNLVFDPNSLRGILYKYAANHSKVLMPVTEDLKNAMIRNGIKGKFHVVCNVVNTDLFKPLIEKKRKVKFKFIHVSHGLDIQKNVSGILRSVEKLKNICADFELTLIINGDQSKYISLAKKLGIYNTHVYFEGLKSISEIARMLSESDCLVMFSHYENYPCVIIEAMSCGIPVISSNVGGIAEHLDETKGILVTPSNENELVMAMKKMMEQHSNYDPKKLRDYSIRHFSYDQIGKYFFEIYKTALT